MNPENLKLRARRLVEGIRLYSLSQKTTWQKIPWFALEADGRTGYSDRYSIAYKAGYWTLESSDQDGSYIACVDLVNGKIVDASSVLGWGLETRFGDVTVDPKGPKRLAPNEVVLKLAYHLEELDATSILNELKREARQKYPGYYKKEEQEAWRDKTREELGLKKIFVRSH